MSKLKKNKKSDSKIRDVKIRNSFVEMESKLKKSFIKLKKGEFLSQEEMFLIKGNIQEIKEILTRDNI